MADKKLIGAHNLVGNDGQDPEAVGGQGAYGTIHVMEEEMKAKGIGTFGDADEAVQTKAEGAAPANKSARKN